LALCGLSTLSALLGAAIPVRLAAVPRPLPDGKSFVFTWQGDIWLASTEGGEAARITQHPAVDHWPCVSPDGKTVAFTSNRDDTWQVYTVPVAGGVPRKVSHHTEGATPLVWFPDGRSILVRGVRDHGGVNATRLLRLYLDGERAEELLFDAYAHDADIAPDSKRILFTRDGNRLYRKGYRGSDASRIWLHDFESGEYELVCDDPGGCRSPLWRPDGKGFYFVSQKSGCFNVWEHELDSGKEKQLTHFTDGAVIIPGLSRNGRAMILRQMFDFHSLDPGKPKALKKIELQAETDQARPEVRRRWYTAVWNNDETGSIDFTDDGLQMCFTTGGDLWVMDTVLREPQAVTTETGIHEREAVFTPDGEHILLLRDYGHSINVWEAGRANTNEYWWQNTAFELNPVTDDEEGKYHLSVSPTGSNIAYCVERGDITVCDRSGSNHVVVARSPYAAWYDWAPDGKWLVCNLSDSDGNGDIWIVSADASREPYNLSRHPNSDYSARWSPDGRKVAFVGKRYDDSVDIYYAYLRESDEHETTRERTIERALKQMKGEDKKKKKEEDDGATNGVPHVVIDFDGLADRVHRIGVKDSSPSHLFWSHDSKALAFRAAVGGKKGTYKVVFPGNLKPEFMTDKQGEQAKWIKKGSKILWLIDRVPHAYTVKYPFKTFQHTNIPDYQRLAFRTIWRLLRDRFYDDGLNNLDWNAMRLKYEDMAAVAPCRAVFERTVFMLMGELNASHLSFKEDDASKKEWGKEWKTRDWKIRTGHLGLRFDLAHNGPGLRVADVVEGGPTDRDSSRVRIGETVLKIDDVAVSSDMAWTRNLTGVYPRDDRLTVVSTNGEERVVTVRTISYEEARKLIREQEIKRKRERVETANDGTLGYLHIARMQWTDLRRFEQEVYACGVGRKGLIIDVRDNPGGFVADRLLAILCRPMHALTIPRDGGRSYPSGYLGKAMWDKPITVLCNQNTTSNGEIFSHAVKTLKRGKLIGVPTQGAVISTPQVRVLDWGTLYVPDRGWFVGDTGQDMELAGCVPDHVVEVKPGDVPAGRDPQLEKAIEVLLADVAAAEARPQLKLIRASDRRKKGK